MNIRTFSIAALAGAIAMGAFVMQPVLRAQDPTLRWVKAAPFPVPEEELYGLSANGKMYVIGGYGKTGEAAPAMVWEYDPASDTWELLPALPGAVHGNAMSFIGNRLHTVSGKMENGGLPDQMAPATADHSVMDLPAGAQQARAGDR